MDHLPKKNVKLIAPLMRVQIPVYTDRWMMGDRFGYAIRRYQLDINGETIDMLRVKLDISGKHISVVEDDCQMIDMS